MKKVLLLALAITMVASVAMADSIAVYADQTGDNCQLNYTGPNLYNAYVIHKTVTGATGSQFKVVNNTGVSFSAAVANPSFLSIGDAFTNLSLAYTSCNTGPNIVVLNLTAAIFATPATNCGVIDVVAAPGTVGILTIDCGFAEIPITSAPFALGNSASSVCQCGVAAEQNTWGKVKSLYR